MSSHSKVVSSDSMAIMPYHPKQSSKEFLRSAQERITTEVFRKTLEQAKYAANIFPSLTPKFNCSNFSRISSASLTTPRCLKTDSCIEIEIFAAPLSYRKPPILIFSHGWGEPSRNYRILLGELANNGYTVLNLTHQSSLDEDPPGLSLKETVELTDKLAAVMANNIQYVIGEVRSGSLKILGDPNKIILAGHSLGGAASIMVSRKDPAISGCVNLDGSLKGNTKTDGLSQPLLMLIGDHEKMMREQEQDPREEIREYAKFSRRFHEEYETLYHNSPHSEKILIPGAGHMDFSDKPIRDYLAGDRGKTLSIAMRVHTIVSCEVLKFLGLYLSR